MLLDGWEDVDAMVEDFTTAETAKNIAGWLAGAEILVAVYERGEYDGEAFVLFRKDTELYEVNGSH